MACLKFRPVIHCKHHGVKNTTKSIEQQKFYMKKMGLSVSSVPKHRVLLKEEVMKEVGKCKTQSARVSYTGVCHITITTKTDTVWEGEDGIYCQFRGR